MKNYISKGERVEYTNPSVDTKIESGAPVVVKGQVGIAYADIEPGETGTLSLDGVYNLRKKAAEVIENMDPVYLDANGEITLAADDGSGPPPVDHAFVGRAMEAAGGAAETINVKLIIL